MPAPIVITYQGITATRNEHARRLGISRRALKARVHWYGADNYDRLFAPVQQHNVLIPDDQGRFATRREHARRIGISYEIIADRIRKFRKGLIPYERVFAPPKKELLLTYLGTTDTVKGWSKRIGVKTSTIFQRISRHGLSEKAMERVLAPLGSKESDINITHKGETHSAAEWARITGIPSVSIVARYHKGATPAQILSKKRWNGKATHDARSKHRKSRRSRELAALGIIV